MTSWRAPSKKNKRASSAAPLDVALRYLAARPRSEREVRRRLQRAGVEPADVERVVSQLQAHGVLDDAAFAQYWVEQRQTFRPRGARLLQAELRQHGLTGSLATDAAESVSDSAEDDAYRAATKRAYQLKTLDERTFTTKLSQFLLRRGFEWDTITPVVSRLWGEATQ